MRSSILLAAFALMLGATAASAAPIEKCPLLKAVYAPIDAEDDMSAEEGKENRYRARHVAKKLPANQALYVLRISEERQKRSYDFAFAYPNGWGGTKLVFSGASATSEKYPINKGGPGGAIFYFDAGLKNAPSDAKGEGVAPAYLMMPEIGVTFWYWAGGDRRFVPVVGMWKVIACED